MSNMTSGSRERRNIVVELEKCYGRIGKQGEEKIEKASGKQQQQGTRRGNRDKKTK